MHYREVLLLRTATNQHADVKDPFFTETHNTFYYLESHRPIEVKKNKRTNLETFNYGEIIILLRSYF